MEQCQVWHMQHGDAPLIIIAYDAARNIAFPYDYGPLLGRRTCVEGTTTAVRNIAFPYDYGPLLGRRTCVEGTTAYMHQLNHISARPQGLPTQHPK